MPDENKTNPDPLENIQMLLDFIVRMLSVFFTKIVPIVAFAFLLIVGLLYLFFKLFGF